VNPAAVPVADALVQHDFEFLFGSYCGEISILDVHVLEKDSLQAAALGLVGALSHFQALP